MTEPTEADFAARVKSLKSDSPRPALREPS